MFDCLIYNRRTMANPVFSIIGAGSSGEEKFMYKN
jgi:hypothetical protein